MNTVVRRFPDIEQMSREAAGVVSSLLVEAVRRRGFASLVLSGGQTPLRLYSILASGEHADSVPWRNVHLFWGDERCVAPDDPASNYRAARDALVSRVPLHPPNVHRIKAEEGCIKAAFSYETELRAFFRQHGRSIDDPEGLFDLTLLGIGADGHIASLFPGSTALGESGFTVASVQAPEGIVPRDRITLSIPAISSSGTILFLAAGAGKAVVADRVLSGGAAAKALPAFWVTARRQVVWYLSDRA